MIQKNNKSRRALLAAFLAPVIVALVSAPVFAECKTGILPQNWCEEGGLMQMIKDIIFILSGMVYVLGTIFIVIAGVMWMTATDDPGKVATAKKRILEISVGIILFIALDVVVAFLGIGSK